MRGYAVSGTLCCSTIFTPNRIDEPKKQDHFHFTLHFPASSSSSLSSSCSRRHGFVSLSEITKRGVIWGCCRRGDLDGCRFEDFVVVSFYRFVFIKDPLSDVSNHLSFLHIQVPSFPLTLFVFLCILFWNKMVPILQFICWKNSRFEMHQKFNFCFLSWYSKTFWLCKVFTNILVFG